MTSKTLKWEWSIHQWSFSHKTCFGFAVACVQIFLSYLAHFQNGHSQWGLCASKSKNWKFSMIGRLQSIIGILVPLPFQSFSHHLIVCRNKQAMRKINDCLVFLSIANGRKMSSAIHSNHRKWLKIICVGIMKITLRRKENSTS